MPGARENLDPLPRLQRPPGQVRGRRTAPATPLSAHHRREAPCSTRSECAQHPRGRADRAARPGDPDRRWTRARTPTWPSEPFSRSKLWRWAGVDHNRAAGIALRRGGLKLQSDSRVLRGTYCATRLLPKLATVRPHRSASASLLTVPLRHRCQHPSTFEVTTIDRSCSDSALSCSPAADIKPP